MGATYTEGVCEDGAAILRDGQIMRIEEVLETLNRLDGDNENSVCVNAHDRCYGGAGGPCPYCEPAQRTMTDILAAQAKVPRLRPAEQKLGPAERPARPIVAEQQCGGVTFEEYEELRVICFNRGALLDEIFEKHPHIRKDFGF